MAEAAGDPRDDRWTKARARSWLVAIAVLVRVVVLIAGHPLEAPDTGGYRELAERLSRAHLAGYSGLRTPGYPLLMLLLDQNTRAIWVAQLVFGVLISLAVFEASYAMCGRARWSFAAALLYAIAPHALVYESYLLTECVTTLSVVLAFLVYARVVMRDRPPPVALSALLGIVIGFGVLVRPMQLFLLPVFGLAMLTWDARWPVPTRAGLVAVFAAPVLAVTLGWCAINKAELGSFTLSTIAGPSMLGVTTDFIERSAPEYQDLVATIVSVRDSVRRATGAESGAAWLAYARLKQTEGVSEAVLSHRMLGMSLSAAANAPAQWTRTVALGWIKFWAAPGGLLRPLTSRALWVIATAPYVLLNVCFISLCLLAPASGRVRRIVATSPGLATIAFVVLSASAIQAVAEGTAGARYAVPFEPLMFIALAAVGAAMRSGRVRP